MSKIDDLVGGNMKMLVCAYRPGDGGLPSMLTCAVDDETRPSGLRGVSDIRGEDADFIWGLLTGANNECKDVVKNGKFVKSDKKEV